MAKMAFKNLRKRAVETVVHCATNLNCGQPESPSQTASRSIQPFLHGSQLFPTDSQTRTDRQADRQTDRPTDRPC